MNDSIICTKRNENKTWDVIMRLATPLTVFSLILMTTTQSHALSCASTGFDIQESFNANQKISKNIIYVLGSFSGKQTPQGKAKKTVSKGTNGFSLIQRKPKATVSTLTFSGKVMTKNGAKPFKQKVKVTATCVASWCGSIPKAGQKTIAALTKTPSGYAMTAGPCSPNTFPGQLDKDWQRLKRLVR